MRSTLHSIASVIGGESAVRAANYAAILFIARIYGARTLGAYAVTLATVTVVVMFADTGLQTVAITELTGEDQQREQFFGQLVLCKAILLGVAAIFLVAFAGVTRPTELFLAIGAWLSLRAILQSFSQLQMAVLKSALKANFIGIVQSIHSAVLFLGLALAFTFRWSFFALLAWLAASQLLELSLATTVLVRHGVSPRWPQRFQFLATLKIAAPFGIAYGIANLIIRADTIVLSKFASLAELGSFTAANSVLLLVYVASWLFASVLLPEMVRLSRSGETLKPYVNQWARWIVLIILPGSLLASLLASKAIVLLFGTLFSTSGVLTSIMLLACPLILLNSTYTASTIATNRRAVLLGTYAAAALLTFLLDFLLGRAFGSLGIAVAIVMREAAMLLCFWLFSSRTLWLAGKLEFRPPSEGN